MKYKKLFNYALELEKGEEGYRNFFDLEVEDTADKIYAEKFLKSNDKDGMLMYNLNKFISKTLLNSTFIENVEKIARYNGKPYSVGDLDANIEDKGTLTNNNDDVYDISLIHDNCTGSNIDTFIVMAEQLSEYRRTKRTPKILIYNIDPRNIEDEPEINNETKLDNSDYTIRPCFSRLKKDFESGEYQSYSSLILNNLDEYQLSNYNEECDRLLSYNLVNMNIENILYTIEDERYYFD